jgi:hypothetical protein
MRGLPNNGMNLPRAAVRVVGPRRLSLRVCRAWHRACEVRVLTPGLRGAEG